MMQTHNLLLIDDDPRVLAALSRQMEDSPFNIFVANNAIEAWQVVAEHTIDAVLCDNMMPEVSGTQLLDLLNDEYPETKRFMLTGKISEEEQEFLRETVGLDGLFTKPHNYRELEATILRALRPEGSPYSDSFKKADEASSERNDATPRRSAKGPFELDALYTHGPRAEIKCQNNTL